MNKNYIVISAVMGALAVALGAFGAHGLKNTLSPELLETYKTGVFYHIIHVVVLLAISLNNKYNLKVAYIFILSGIIFFSFSLYAYSITEIKFFAMITPFGGLSLILGWIVIAITVYKNKD